MFLADALHHFARIGDAIQDGNPAQIVAASDGVLQAFAGYDIERPEWGQRQPKPTFDVWPRMVPTGKRERGHDRHPQQSHRDDRGLIGKR